MESNSIPGDHRTSTDAVVIEKVQTLIMEDHHLTVQESADEVGISVGSEDHILNE